MAVTAATPAAVPALSLTPAPASLATLHHIEAELNATLL